MALTFQVTFDALDPDRVARFWAKLLGYEFPPPPEGHATWPDFLRTVGVPEDQMDKASAIVDPEGNGPRIFLQKVPEPRSVKNRVHLDVNAAPRGTPPDERARLVAELVARAESLGGTKVREVSDLGEHWVVMHDPEGNEFCIQ